MFHSSTFHTYHHNSSWPFKQAQKYPCSPWIKLDFCDTTVLVILHIQPVPEIFSIVEDTTSQVDELIKLTVNWNIYKLNSVGPPLRTISKEQTVRIIEYRRKKSFCKRLPTPVKSAWMVQTPSEAFSNIGWRILPVFKSI